MWAIFLVGGAATVASGTLPLPSVLVTLRSSAPVLLFLLALFVLAGGLEEAGALEHLARWLVGRTDRPDRLPEVLFVGFGIASAFLVNDALVVVGVPVLVSLGRRLALPVRPLLLTLAFGVTVGSALTPFGNPQNLLVSIDSGIRDPVLTFLRYLLVPTGLSLGVGALYVRWCFRGELASRAVTLPDGGRIGLFPHGRWGERLKAHPALVIAPATLLALVVVDAVSEVFGVVSPPSWEAALAGAALLIVVTPRRSPLVRRVNWEILLLFVGLFLVVGGAVATGLIAQASRFYPLGGPAHPLAGLGSIALTSALGPQFVSNVPWVALQIPVLHAAGYSASTPIAWLALAAVSTLAGNVSILGAASNLIVVDLAERAGVRIDLRTFVRFGLPIALASIGIVVASLAVGL